MTAARLSQNPVLAIGGDDSPVARLSQEVILVLVPGAKPARISQNPVLVIANSVGNLDARITQDPVLVIAGPGVFWTFARFTNETFHDWVISPDTGENYASYMRTWFAFPEEDRMNWSQSPFAYILLKNGTLSSDSLKVQVAWDWSRPDG